MFGLVGGYWSIGAPAKQVLMIGGTCANILNALKVASPAGGGLTQQSDSIGFD